MSKKRKSYVLAEHDPLFDSETEGLTEVKMDTQGATEDAAVDDDCSTSIDEPENEESDEEDQENKEDEDKDKSDEDDNDVDGDDEDNDDEDEDDNDDHDQYAQRSGDS